MALRTNILIISYSWYDLKSMSAEGQNERPANWMFWTLLFVGGHSTVIFFMNWYLSNPPATTPTWDKGKQRVLEASSPNSFADQEEIRSLRRDLLLLDLGERGCSANLERDTNWNQPSQPNSTWAIGKCSILLNYCHQRATSQQTRLSEQAHIEY